ncbi:hypothetical protein BGZ49_000574 [Haplosporangium sp. Z 27]|nr:hypothetical protein BGZ49_000574 [Haplosporangium sp. Z 27]
MKSSSPTPSRASSSSNISKTTALDTPHPTTDLHHNNNYHHHHHKLSDATNEDTLKDSLYALSENSSGAIKVDSMKSNGNFSDIDLKRKDFRDPIVSVETDLENVDLGWICTWADLPQWMQDNPAVITGYRRATYSYYKCIRSIMFLHNETGSCYPAVFYGFYCHQTLQIVYISVISALGGATIIATMQKRFQIPQFRWVRSGLFLALGLSGLCPIIHGIVLYGFPLAQKAAALNYMFCMGAAYVFGVLIYGSRTPECFFPGKFDNFGASHQIFHICVLIGCTVHFAGVIKAMSFWHDNDPTCAIPIDQMKIMFG